MPQLLLAPLILIILYVGVNLFDPPLSPDFDQYFYKENVDPSENGAVFLQGINAPEGQDLFEFATLIWDTKPERTEPFYNPNTEEELKLVTLTEFTPNNLTFECWTSQDYEPDEHSVCATEEQIREALTENALIMDRYTLLWPYKRFYHDTLYGFARGQEMIQINDLRNAQLALMARDGHADKALDIWVRRQNFLNMVMADGQNLVFKAIIMINYSRNLHVLPIIASRADQETLNAHKDALDSALNVPIFGDDGFDIRATLSSEYFTVFEAEELMQYMRHPNYQKRATSFLMYRKNATANQFLTHAKNVLNATQLPLENMLPTVLASQKTFYPEISFLNMLYNPVGKLILGGTVRGAELFDNRIAQIMHARMLRLYIDAKSHGIGADDMPAFMHQTRDRYINDYTNKPFNWDAEKHEIYFNQGRDEFTRRYSVVY
ncbi:MAG: hypothetical protein ACTHOO_01000 [Alcanivorax sp.]